MKGTTTEWDAQTDAAGINKQEECVVNFQIHFK